MSQSRVTIVVDSRYGSTLSLAKAIAEGAASEHAEVRLRRVALSEPEFSIDTEQAIQHTRKSSRGQFPHTHDTG